LHYEYCSITESAISFESAFQKFGQPELAEIVENIVLNAAQAHDCRMEKPMLIVRRTTNTKLLEHPKMRLSGFNMRLATGFPAVSSI